MPWQVLRLHGDPGDLAVLAKAGVNQAAHLVALHEEDRLNIEPLVAAGRACTGGPRRPAPLEAYAQVADTSLEHALAEVLAGAAVPAPDATLLGELKSREEELAETTKQKERVNIRVIPKLLEEGRLKATRRPGVHCRWGRGSDGGR